MDEIQTQEFKDLLSEYPLEVISNELQIRKMTIAFALKTSCFFDPNMKEIPIKQKYLSTGYALYQRGYVRNYSTTGAQHTVAGRFDASTLEGWKNGLKQIEEKVQNRIKQLEKTGVIWDKEKLDPKNIPVEKQENLIKSAEDGKISWPIIEPYISKELLSPHIGKIALSKMGF